MDARHDISRFSIPLTVTALLLLASLAYMPHTAADALRYSLAGQYLRFDWLYGSPVLSKLAAVLLLAVGPMMFYIFDRRYPIKLNVCFPLLFSVFVFSCRDALSLSPVHVAAFFLTWAVYYSFRASLETYDADNPFLSMLLLSTASLFFVPLVWMAPLIAFLDNNDSAQKGKTVIGSVLGLLLPMAFTVGIHAMATGFQDISEPVTKYLEMAVDVDGGLPQIQQSATALKVLLMLVALIWASVLFLTVFHTLDVTAERCHMRCILYGTWLAATALVFGNSLDSLPWMLVLMPLSFFLFAFFGKVINTRIGIFLLTLLLMAIVAERVVTLL